MVLENDKIDEIIGLKIDIYISEENKSTRETFILIQTSFPRGLRAFLWAEKKWAPRLQNNKRQTHYH